MSTSKIINLSKTAFTPIDALNRIPWEDVTGMIVVYTTRKDRDPISINTTMDTGDHAYLVSVAQACLMQDMIESLGSAGEAPPPASPEKDLEKQQFIKSEATLAKQKACLHKFSPYSMSHEACRCGLTRPRPS